MKAKLIKTDKGNYILIDPTKGVYDKGYQIGNSIECDVHKLSKQNCDEIFGFNKAMKLNKDKVFTLEDMGNLWDFCTYNKGTFAEIIQSLQQPTEIEVEIEMEDVMYTANMPKEGEQRPSQRPKLDENGCLILTKK